MIYEYTNNTLDELIKEANQSDNKLALAITERFEEEVENLNAMLFKMKLMNMSYKIFLNLVNILLI